MVSIITPSLNQGHFIGDALASVHCQQGVEVEHLVVDGGSRDETVAVVQAHARRHPSRLHWLSEPDGGQAEAVNKGLRLAQGEILGWLNADDAYLLRSTLREVVAAFNRYPETDVIYGDGVLISVDNQLLKVLCMPPFSRARLARRCCLLQPAVFWRRHVSDAHQLDTTLALAMDYEFWLRLSTRYRFRHVPRPWAADRNYPARRSLLRRADLDAETCALQTRHPAPPWPAWRRAAETLLVKWPDLARGLGWVPWLYAARRRLALPLGFGPLGAMVRNQLFRRVEELADAPA